MNETTDMNLPFKGLGEELIDIDEFLTPKKLGADLPREEIDFSELPQDEVEACVHYEYARESATLIKEAVRIRRWTEKEWRTKKTAASFRIGGRGEAFERMILVTRGMNLIYDSHLYSALAGQQCFPRLPWQKLKAEEKEELRIFPRQVEKFCTEATFKAFPPLLIEKSQPSGGENEMTLAQWKQTVDQKGKALIAGFIQINLDYPPSVLKEQFEEWLNANHPKGDTKPSKDRGRNSLRDRLNSLGALRLRYHCHTFKEARMKFTRPSKNRHPFHYADNRAWIRAGEQALKHFDDLFPRLIEWPIHFGRKRPAKRRLIHLRQLSEI